MKINIMSMKMSYIFLMTFQLIIVQQVLTGTTENDPSVDNNGLKQIFDQLRTIAYNESLQLFPFKSGLNDTTVPEQSIPQYQQLQSWYNNLFKRKVTLRTYYAPPGGTVSDITAVKKNCNTLTCEISNFEIWKEQVIMNEPGLIFGKLKNKETSTKNPIAAVPKMKVTTDGKLKSNHHQKSMFDSSNGNYLIDSHMSDKKKNMEAGRLLKDIRNKLSIYTKKMEAIVDVRQAEIPNAEKVVVCKELVQLKKYLDNMTLNFLSTTIQTFSHYLDELKQMEKQPDFNKTCLRNAGYYFDEGEILTVNEGASDYLVQLKSDPCMMNLKREYILQSLHLSLMMKIIVRYYDLRINSIIITPQYLLIRVHISPNYQKRFSHKSVEKIYNDTFPTILKIDQEQYKSVLLMFLNQQMHAENQLQKGQNATQGNATKNGYEMEVELTERITVVDVSIMINAGIFLLVGFASIVVVLTVIILFKTRKSNAKFEAKKTGKNVLEKLLKPQIKKAVFFSGLQEK